MRPLSATDLNVSRETFERLEIYADLLIRWNPAVNLVSKSSIDDLWQRHFADSVQICHLAPAGFVTWADLGSGGGFPGLVAAICGFAESEDRHFTLVESDLRKATFLRTVVRETGIRAQVISERIESIAPLNADVVSARALAALSDLLEYAARHLASGGVALFPKGARWKIELVEARKAWQFDLEEIASQIEPDAFVLKIKGISRA